MNYIKDFTFQESITSPTTGEIFYSSTGDNVTIYISGNSTSRTILFQGCDESGNWYSIQGVRLSDFTKATSTTGTAEVWNFDMTYWVGIRMNVTAVAGGTVNIIGKVVDSGHALAVSTTTSKVGSLANAVTLQANASTAGNGIAYTPTSPMALVFEISGTSTSRTIYFELAGPKGVYVTHPAIKVGDSTYTPVASTTSGNDTTPTSYEVDIPAGYSFIARVGAVVGGDVDISGWAVAQ